MQTIISDFVRGYEEGRISRRELIRNLATLAAVGAAAPTATAQAGPFNATRIDHISVQVSDLQRSVDFYQRIFGLSIRNQDTANEIVRMGTTSVIVSLHHKQPTAIVDHFAIAVENFSQESATAKLQSFGLTPAQNLDYGFHVRDPEGIPVQIVGD